MTLQALFKKPNTWTQHACARNRKGTEVSLFSDDAVRFCLMAAIQKCYPTVTERMAAIHAVVVALRAHCSRSRCAREGRYIDWNDARGRTIADVRRLVKAAKV